MMATIIPVLSFPAAESRRQMLDPCNVSAGGSYLYNESGKVRLDGLEHVS